MFNVCDTLEVLVSMITFVRQVMFYRFSLLFFSSTPSYAFHLIPFFLSFIYFIILFYWNNFTIIVRMVRKFCICDWHRFVVPFVVTIDDNWVNDNENWMACTSIDCLYWIALADTRQRWIDYAEQRRILFFSGSDTVDTISLNCNLNREKKNKQPKQTKCNK